MANFLGIAQVTHQGTTTNRREYQVWLGTTGGHVSTITDKIFEIGSGDQIDLRVSWDDFGVPPMSEATHARVLIFYETVSTAVATPNTNAAVTGALYDSQWQSLGGTTVGQLNLTAHATSDGTTTGAARIGTYRIRIAVKRDVDGDGDVTDLGDWGAHDSDGNGAAPTGTISSVLDVGILRYGIKVSSVAFQDQDNAVPAGTPPVYGYPDSIQTRATYTGAPNDSSNTNAKLRARVSQGVAGSETERTNSLSAALGASPGIVWAGDTGGGATLTRNGGCDSRFNVNGSDLGCKLKYEIDGNGLVVPASGARKWTHIHSGPTGWTLGDVDTAPATRNLSVTSPSDTFRCDPRITLTAPTYNFSLYNREETVTATDLIAQNARAVKIAANTNATTTADKQATIKVIDSVGNTQEGSDIVQSPDAANNYDFTYVIPSTAAATNDLTGQAKKLRVSFAVFAANNPVVSDLTAQFNASRKWRLRKLSTDATDTGVKTGKTSGADDVTSRNRGQTLHLDTYVFNARGTILASPTIHWNVRPIGSETYDESNTSVALASGRLQTSYGVDTDETVGARSVVVGSQTTAAANHPRTGTGGSGNFAESDTATGEWTVSSTYTSQTHLQKSTTRSVSAPSGGEDTSFTIGEDVTYCWTYITDSTSDPVNGVLVTQHQLDPEGIEETSKTATTGSDGWTVPTNRFQVLSPASSSWKIRSNSSAGAHNGNTWTDDQMYATLSAFTANKNIVIGLGPTLGVTNTLGLPTPGTGDLAVPGDRVLVGIAFLVNGIRTPPDESLLPKVALASFDQAQTEVEFLQADGTWQPIFYGGRTVTDAVTTNGSAIVTSATAAFVAADKRKIVKLAGFGGTAHIISVDSATQVTLSSNASASATGQTMHLSDTKRILDASITNASNVLNSASSNFTAADVGKLILVSPEDSGIPVGTTITVVNSTTQVQMSNNATLTTTALELRFGYGTQWFDSKQLLENRLEAVVSFGTAGQGVTTSNGYVMDTSTWPKRMLFVLAHLKYNSQSFYDDMTIQFGRRHIKIREADGTPAYSDAWALTVPNGTLTLSGDTATLNFDHDHATAGGTSRDWADQIDHGNLAGLVDDDHAQYTRADGTRAFTGNQSLGGFKLTNVADPTSAQDAATKAYADALANGLDVKASVRVATTANITLSGEQTIDGVAIVSGNRVLVKDQTTGSQNGIYVAAVGSWTRSTDADLSAEVTSGMFVPVTEGSANAASAWVLTTADPIVLGTTSLTFGLFSMVGQYVAGDGITISGATVKTITMAPHSHIGAHSGDTPIGDRS